MDRLPWYLFFTYWVFIITIIFYLFLNYSRTRITTLPLNLLCSIGVVDIFFTRIFAFQIYSTCIHILPLTIVRHHHFTRESVLFAICFILLYLLFIHGICKHSVINVYNTYMRRRYNSMEEVIQDRFFCYL
jgi:hypothetical protein